MSKDKFDFDRVMLLFNVAEKARAHGSAYTNLVAAADAELREINNGGPDVPKPRVITPAAGPASSQVQNPDGTTRPIADPQKPANVDPDFAAGKQCAMNDGPDHPPPGLNEQQSQRWLAGYDEGLAERKNPTGPGYDPIADQRGVQQSMPNTEARETPPDSLRKI